MGGGNVNGPKSQGQASESAEIVVSYSRVTYCDQDEIDQSASLGWLKDVA
jgi:hypothetical protein